MMFSDRKEAGQLLANQLASKYKNKNALILCIPRGGIPVGYEIAMILNAELSVVITKKLPHPSQEELAIGAAAEDGSVFLTTYSRTIPEETIKRIVQEQMEEIRSRIQRFRKGKALPEIRNRIVIIVDDGIATGSTIVPAIKLCKAKNAARVIVAAPVSGRRYVSEINALADEVVIVDQPDDFYAVGQVYEDFHHLSDKEVTDLLRDFDGKTSANYVY